MNGDPPAEYPGASEYAMRERAADKLAYEVARLVEMRIIGERSGAADALLNYLDIGGTYGPPDVPAWMEQYRRNNKVGE